MRNKSILLTGILFSSIFFSCVPKKEKSTVRYTDCFEEGTYGGILRTEENPGVFRMVAFDSMQYEVIDKFLIQGIQFITHGGIELKGDLFFIGGIPYRFGRNMLFNETDTLFRLSEDTKLPTCFSREMMVENRKGGGVASLERFCENNEGVALFYFGGHVYKMKLDIDSSQITEYVDGENKLFMEVIDPAPEPVTTPVFYDGKQQYEFTITNPCHYLFSSAEGKDYDVTYFNGDSCNLVLLLSEGGTDFYLLPQTQAWAKGAEYSDGKTTWYAQGKKATLFIGDKELHYTQIEK